MEEAESGEGCLNGEEAENVEQAETSILRLAQD